MLSSGEWLKSIAPEFRLEGELLLAEHLALSRTQTIAYPETQIEDPLLARLDADLLRLKEGEPLAYILGCREFWGLEFMVSPAVLVPRPETELLVEILLSKVEHSAKVLDLGTGSGAIAIALAHERPELEVTATDVSLAALEIARTNPKQHNVTVNFRHSNWFSAIDDQYDVIVSNPPYINPKDEHLPTLRHEPQLALVAEDDGLQALHHIALKAPAYLAPGGLLLMEHGYDQGASMVKRLLEHNYMHPSAHHDLAGHHRATSARRS